jgi:hypothetical protein
VVDRWRPYSNFGIKVPPPPPPFVCESLKSVALSLCRLALFWAACLAFTGCFDSECVVSSNEVHSAADRRIGDDAYRAWEFKYTDSGKWNVSCRPRTIWSEFGLSYWTDLRPCGREGAGKAFEGSRWGHRIVLVVYKDGEAQVMAATGKDVLVYDLNEHSFFGIVYRRN